MPPAAASPRAYAIFSLIGITESFIQYNKGLAGAGHQAWSANLYSTIGDMFPKSTIGTITGVGNL